MNLTSFYNNERVNTVLRDVESARLASDLDAPTDTNLDQATNILRLAAYSAVADLLENVNLANYLRRPQEFSELSSSAIVAFRDWNGYLEAALDGNNPGIDHTDLLIFAFLGFFAKKPTQVRDLLRRQQSRALLDSIRMRALDLSWIDRVQANITHSILLTLIQESHDDLILANRIISELVDDQREFEANWLETQSNKARESLQLLGLYHLAQATTRTAEFIKTGSVAVDGKLVADFAPELRRLLVKAEEFLTGSADLDRMLWVTASGITLSLIRESSIWIRASGISDRIDQLLKELTNVGRERPLFSLLPSQQEALESFLLDRSKIAIVLQMPTSAGKTLLAEFSIAQTFDAYRTRTKVVYIVPTRALATQVRRTLTEDLGPLGINVSAAGSAFEEDPYELSLLEDADGVVVATPEKIDLMLRAHPKWFEDLRLIVVDEAHLIHDRKRGVQLELLIANLRREQADARLLLLTPFVENANEIASWLDRSRGHSISVHWKPAKILLGLADISGAGRNRKLQIDWMDPHSKESPNSLVIPTQVKSSAVSSGTGKIIFLANIFKKLGTVLAMYSASPKDAEAAAFKFAEEQEILPQDRMTPQLRVAIALARHQYGEDSRLAFCLERGVAFHHSSLSPVLRYIIEDQIRSSRIGFVAATSTLAQGMNFPVSTVLIHSVHKPYGGGNFTSSEFWNIAGRAGRVGLVEKGLVVFANKEHDEQLSNYSEHLSSPIKSALLTIINQIDPNAPLKEQYRLFEEVRPFIQYLAHAAASTSPSTALRNLEELLEQSLMVLQATPAESRRLRSLATAYLEHISDNSSLLKTADVTGLGSFSFEELYAKIMGDPVLTAGPKRVAEARETGLVHLIDALKWLPELDLAIGKGLGEMDVEAVAKVVQGWIDGRQIHELSDEFPGEDDASKVRKTGKYLNSTVSQTLSWGAHAYLRGWAMSHTKNSDISDLNPAEAMLPAYIQYGVNTPEATVACLLGVAREFAVGFGAEYRRQHGELEPRQASLFKSFVYEADDEVWARVVLRSKIANVDPSDARIVFRQMQGVHN